VNEDREQTRAIHRLQRERQTLEGLLLRQDRDEILRVHRNAQRLLRPLLVANPFARELTFLDHRTRTRRDHMKYLTLIRAIALLHQHQRKVCTAAHHGQAVRYLEVTKDDIATANRLAHEVLGRSLDELPPQTRRLLGLLDPIVAKEAERAGLDRSDVRFTRREVREHTGWTDFQVRCHLEKLVAMEYVLVHRGGRGQSFVYELLYDGQGQDGGAFLIGLLDPERLPDAPALRYDGNFEGSSADFEGPSSPHRAPNEPSLRETEGDATPCLDEGNGADHALSAENAPSGTPLAAASYVPEPLLPLAASFQGR
jgi:hypothetical protein